MMTPRFSIRNKFLAVISSLLMICIVSYLALAVHTFKRDKTELIFDLHRGLAHGLVNEMETTLKSVADKLEVFALMQEGSSSANLAIVENLLQNDSNIVFLFSTNRWIQGKDKKFVKSEYLETYGLNNEFFDSLINEKKLPIDDILKKGVSVWGVSVPQAPPLLAIGKAVIRENSRRVPVAQYAVVAFVRLDDFFLSTNNLRDSQVFLSNNMGELIAQTKAEFTAKNKLIERAMQSKFSNEVLTFEEEGKEWMGAYSRSKDGQLYVYASVEEEKAFAAMNDFLRRSLLFAGLVATLAFIAAILFSRTLTRPIQILVDGMAKVTDGELTTQIQVPTNDETSLLAASFNTMIRELHDSRVQLEDINRDLEEKVKERTAQLEEQNRAVKEAQEALIRTTRLASVGEIAARAAHEVLNPLTGMMTRLGLVQKRFENKADADLQMLEDIVSAWVSDFQKGGMQLLVQNWQAPSSVDPKISLFQEDLENLNALVTNLSRKGKQINEDTMFLLNESQRISKIVQSMRALSHVRGIKEKHSVHQLLKDCSKIMADLCDQHKIELRLDFKATMDLSAVDKDEFIQSMTNLLRNSIQAIKDHAGPQNKTISIETSLQNKQILIDVADNGVGIDPQYQAKLFESQFSTKSKEEGTGLGLSISRRFIRSFGGDIVLLRSAPGSGTCFRISLPLIEGKKEVAA